MSKSVTTVESESDSSVLKKLAKGYGWEIKAYGSTMEEIFEKIKTMDQKLREEYGEKE